MAGPHTKPACKHAKGTVSNRWGTRVGMVLKVHPELQMSLLGHDVDGVGRIDLHVLTVRLGLVFGGCRAARGSGTWRGLWLGVRVSSLLLVLPGLVEAGGDTVDLGLRNHLPVSSDPPVLVLLVLK